MNPEISRQQAHDLLETLLLCRSARGEVAGYKAVIAEYEAKLADEEAVRAAALARRGEFLAGISSEADWDDDAELIATLEGFRESDEKCSSLKLTIQGQQKLLGEAERRLAARKADRASTIATINGRGEL